MELVVEEDGATGVIYPVGRGIKVNLRVPVCGWGKRCWSGCRLLDECMLCEEKYRDSKRPSPACAGVRSGISVDMR
jgi:uncharacterized protein (DUF983 family)